MYGSNLTLEKTTSLANGDLKRIFMPVRHKPVTRLVRKNVINSKSMNTRQLRITNHVATK